MMAIYNEKTGNTLITNATDATPGPGPITVRKLNGSVINWALGDAVITTIPGVTVYVNEQGVDRVEPLTGSEPPNGSTVKYGEYTYTLWDGQDEQPTVYTREVFIEGITSLPSSGYVASGQIERFNASAAVFSGSNLTSWAGSVASTALTLVGVPTKATPTGGTSSQQVVVGASQGFTFDAAGWPISNADRTLQMLWKPTGSGRFGGFGYGTNSAGQAFSIVVDDTNRLSIDIGSSRFYLNVTPVSQMCFVTARLSDGVLTGWLGLNQVPLTDSVTGVTAMSHAVSLSTTITRGNLCRSFSNNTSPAEVCVALAYGRALTDAEIVTNCLAANAEYLADTTVTAQGTPAVVGGTLTANAFSVAGTAGEVWGSVNAGAKQGTTAPTEAELASGTGLVTRATFALNGSATWQIDATGAASGQIHRGHSWFYDMVGGKSAIATSANITTSAPADVTAPVITNLAGDPTGTTTADLTVDVNEGGNGVWGVYLATATTPTRAQLRAGTDGDGAPLLFTATTAPGAAATLTATAINLAENTGYQVAYQQDDGAGNQSAVAESAVFTTDAVPVGIPAQVDGLRTGSTNVGRINNSTTLKTVTGDGLPAGWVNAGGCIYPTANNLTLDGYNLQDYRVFSNDKTGLTITNNLFGATTSAGVPAGSQPGGSLAGSSVNRYMLQITPGSDDCTVRYNDFKGFFGANAGSSEPACIGKTFTSGGVCARRTQIDHNRFWDYESDVFHDAGDTVFEWNWIGFPAQANADINPYSGTPGDYNSGDLVTTFIGSYQYVWRCTTSPATVAPPASTNPGTNASWAKWSISGAHTDVVNPRAMLYDSTYQYNNFDVNLSDTTTPFFNKRVGNVNQILRIVPNVAGPSYVGGMTVRGNRMARSPSQAALTTQNANASGGVNWSFIDNRWGRRSNGTFWSGSTTRIASWTGNTDAISGATVAQP